jgi:hypothetical protein
MNATGVIAAEHHHQQVGLFGLGGHARRRTGALDVHHDQRQFDHYRQVERLALERDTRP